MHGPLLDAAEPSWFVALAQTANDAVVVHGYDGRIALWNPAAAELFGCSEQEAVGASIFELLRVESDAALRETLEGLPQTGGVCLRSKAWAPDGRRLQLALVISPLGGNGAEPAVLCVCRDEGSRFELETQNQRLAAVLRSSGDAITLQSLDGVITAWNQGAERLYGYSEQEALGMSALRLVPPQRQDEYQALLQAARRGQELAPFQTDRLSKDGRRLNVWLSVTLLWDGTSPMGIATSERDITEWRRVKQALEAANRELDQRVKARTAELESANAELQAQIGRRREMERALEQNLGWLRGIMEHAPVVICLKSPPGVYQRINRQLALLMDRKRDEILNHDDRHLFPAEIAAKLAENDRRVLQAGRPIKFEERVVGPCGERTYLSMKFPVYTTGGELQGVGTVAMDITDRKHFQSQLAWEREKAVVTLSSIGEGVITCDRDGRVEYLNPVAESLTQWSCAEAAGRPLAEVLTVMDERSRTLVSASCYWAPEGCHFSAEAHHVVVGRDGAAIPVQETASPIRGRDGQLLGAVIILRDVSASRQLARRLSYEATHDPLTGLINRAEFHRLLQEAIDDVRREGHQHVLCYLDLDGFKPVNDKAGHSAGDELLRQLSGLLRSELRGEDVLGRLGGDEFAVLLHHCSLAAAERIANDLRERVERFRFTWKGMVFQVTVSIGLTPITTDSGDFEAVRAAADDACYVAKEQGRNRVRVLGGRGGVARREQDWRGKLETALVEDAFVLLCQPILPLTACPQHPWGEVLLRMRADDGKLLPPGSFLPVAERYNLLASLDRWVISRVFARAPRDGFTLTINLSSGVWEQEDFPHFLDELVRRYGTDPGRYCFEFNEINVVANYTRAQRLLTQLKERGFLLSLDRFGSAYASFGYLRQLPLDFLKIDGEVVKDICQDRLDRTMVGSLNEIAHTLEKRTVAASAQNEQVLAQLRQIGVDWAQGFALSAPQPLERFIGGVG